MAAPRAKAAAPRAAAPAPPPPPSQAAPQVYDSPVIAREVVRPIMPAIAGRAVALNRAGLPVQRAAAEAGVDQFYIPPHLPPPGWSWEWKEDTVLGEIRQGVAALQAQVGWEAVMYESYPGVFAPEYDEHGKPTKGPVRRGGLALKERAATLTKEAFEDEKRKAAERVGTVTRQYSRGLGSESSDYDPSAARASYIKQAPTTTLPGYDPGGAPKPRQPID